MIRLPASGVALGRCVCGAVVHEDGWRDECSEREWLLSGLCQDCQDRVFLASDGNARHPLRFGALAAHCIAGRDVTDLAVLPFLFVPEFGTLAWEADPRFASDRSFRPDFAPILIRWRGCWPDTACMSPVC